MEGFLEKKGEGHVNRAQMGTEKKQMGNAGTEGG